VQMVRGLVGRLPVGLLMKLGLATLKRPRTRGWANASAAIEEYVQECEATARKALRLDMQGAE
jgi:heterodisulfide reductase subunit C2